MRAAPTRRVVLPLLLLLAVASPPPPAAASPTDEDEEARRRRRGVAGPEREASAASRRGAPPGDGARAWRKVLEADPRSTTARIQLGILWISSPNGAVQERGIAMLEETFDPGKVDDLLPVPGPQAFVLAQTVGRYRWQMKEYGPALRFLRLAKKAKPDDVCTDLMLASMIDIFPPSVQDADRSMELYHEGMDALIASSEEGRLQLDPMTVNTVPGCKTDPYVHCLFTLFYHSFYYRANAALSARKHFEVAGSVWPELLYVSPRLLAEDGKSLRPKPLKKPCVRRRLRLGVASGFLSENSSVTADFQGVLQRLDRDVFDVTYIFFNEQGSKEADLIFDRRDNHRIFRKEGDGHIWMRKARKDIEAMDLDILFFLDLTMSSFAHRMGMSRLAPVQAVSHGHPITSGFPRRIMDYYISWAAAELPPELAQRHYTEELRLLPATSIHQYYDNRVTDDGRSANDGMPFRHLVSSGRSSSFPDIPAGSNWYLCMQKPFKLHPEFDVLVRGVLDADPDARVLLHEEEREHNRRIFLRRLADAGCDMDRIHFVPVQPHHRLLALYKLSDVVLDSYPASGCTTTREVLELGKAVVTLPAKYLGSRWSLGYYNMLGDSRLNDMVIADSPEEYVCLAARLGSDEGARREAERRIEENVHKLFRRVEAVLEWTKMFFDIAPVEVAMKDGTCTRDDTGANSVKAEL